MNHKKLPKVLFYKYMRDMRYFGSYKNLKNALFYLTIILFFAFCKSDIQSNPDEMPPLYPAPLTVALNTDEGYFINPLTGNNIQPIVNSLGDTVKTGIPIPVKGRVIHPDSVAQPIMIPAGMPEVVPTHLNVHNIPETLTVIPVDTNSLDTFTPGVDTSSFVLVNSTGDTLPTGVPIPVQRKIVPCIQPQPVKALPPGMKENAIINMKYLDVNQGMNSSYVLSILEDSQSNLWFGTGGGGVSMYNGETFIHFTNKEGLSDNLVYSIVEDSQGNLWFGTYLGGVSMYDGGTFTHFTEKEGLSNNYVWSILEDSDSNLWFGTWGGGVSMYNGETFTHFTEKEGLSNNYVRSIMEDSKGNLWFGTYRGGVSKYNGKTFTHFTEKEGLSNNDVLSILEDSHGNLWFATGGGGVSMYDGETFTHITVKEGLSSNNVRSILEDRNNNLWFGTEGGGVSMYNGETFTHFTENEGLSNNTIWSILEDSHDNLWFGTFGGGVSSYNGETFIHFTENVGLCDNFVWSILEDSHGILWFGTESGVCMYNGKSFKHFTEKEGLGNNLVTSIMEDGHGNLWFGTGGGGVRMYNGQTFTHFTENEGLSSNDVWDILKDSQGNLWFASDGVSMYNGETFTHFTEKEGLINNGVWTILEDSHGNLWFGTMNGVSMYNGETFTHFTEKEGLSNNDVRSILEDSDGNIWFGTRGGGMSIYNGESFTHFTEKEGLSNNNVWSILEDSNSNIWISTEKGLNLIVSGPDSDSVTRNHMPTSAGTVIHTYGLQDGLKGMDFLLNSVLLDSKNRIWWGCSKSLIMLDMNDFKIPVEPPALQMNRIEINEQFIDYRHLKENDGIEMEISGVAKYYNFPLNLELPYNNNHLTFHFSSKDWSAPHKIKYSYKMEGLDNNWSLPTSEAKADYRSLPYGTYTFKVRAIGGAQKWSETFEYTFTILPPWWRSNYAYMFYIVFITAIIIVVIRIREKSLIREKKILEQKISERTTEIAQQKERVEESEAKLSSTISSIDDLVFVLDKAGVFQEFYNPGKHKMLYSEAESYIDKHFENVGFPESVVQKFTNAFKELMQKDSFEEFDYSIKKEDKVFWFNAKISPRRNVKGELSGITIVARDVTDRKQSEEQLKELNTTKDTFFSILAHDLKNPFSSLHSMSDMMIDNYQNLEEKDKFMMLKNMNKSAEEIFNLLENLLTWSNSQRGRIEYSPEKFNLSRLIQVNMNLHKLAAEKKAVVLTADIVDDLPAFGDREMINTVIRNLINNAVKFSNKDGTVEVKILDKIKLYEVVVSDRGVGITAENVKKLFRIDEKYKSVGTAGESGTGLGLVLCKEFVAKNGGEIWCKTKEGSGTDFHFTIPRYTG